MRNETLKTFLVLTLLVAGLAEASLAQPAQPIAHWKADNSTQNSAGTASILGKPAVTYEQGLLGQAFSFTPNSAQITTDLDSQPSVMRRSTWSCWINTQHTNGGTILSVDDGGFDRSVQLENGFVSVFTGTTNWRVAQILPGEWTHVAVVWRQHSIVCYVNGEAFEYKRNVGDQPTLRKLAIGRNPTFGGSFIGLIDDIQIFDRALSKDEVRSLYEEARSTAAQPGSQELAAVASKSDAIKTASSSAISKAEPSSPPSLGTKAAAPTEATLLEPMKVQIVRDGKTIGSTTMKEGAKVQIERIEEGRALLKGAAAGTWALLGSEWEATTLMEGIIDSDAVLGGSISLDGGLPKVAWMTEQGMWFAEKVGNEWRIELVEAFGGDFAGSGWKFSQDDNCSVFALKDGSPAIAYSFHRLQGSKEPPGMSEFRIAQRSGADWKVQRLDLAAGGPSGPMAAGLLGGQPTVVCYGGGTHRSVLASPDAKQQWLAKPVETSPPNCYLNNRMAADISGRGSAVMLATVTYYADGVFAPETTELIDFGRTPATVQQIEAIGSSDGGVAFSDARTLVTYRPSEGPRRLAISGPSKWEIRTLDPELFGQEAQLVRLCSSKAGNASMIFTPKEGKALHAEFISSKLTAVEELAAERVFDMALDAEGRPNVLLVTADGRLQLATRMKPRQLGVDSGKPGIVRAGKASVRDSGTTTPAQHKVRETEPSEARSPAPGAEAPGVARVDSAAAAAHIGQTVIVRGNVATVRGSSRTGMTYINFGKPYPDMEFAASFESSNGGLANLRELEGRQSVEIEGTISADGSGRPHIVITSLDQVKSRGEPKAQGTSKSGNDVSGSSTGPTSSAPSSGGLTQGTDRMKNLRVVSVADLTADVAKSLKQEGADVVLRGRLMGVTAYGNATDLYTLWLTSAGANPSVSVKPAAIEGRVITPLEQLGNWVGREIEVPVVPAVRDGIGGVQLEAWSTGEPRLYEPQSAPGPAAKFDPRAVFSSLTRLTVSELRKVDFPKPDDKGRLAITMGLSTEQPIVVVGRLRSVFKGEDRTDFLMTSHAEKPSVRFTVRGEAEELGELQKLEGHEIAVVPEHVFSFGGANGIEIEPVTFLYNGRPRVAAFSAKELGRLVSGPSGP